MPAAVWRPTRQDLGEDQVGTVLPLVPETARSAARSAPLEKFWVCYAPTFALKMGFRAPHTDPCQSQPLRGICIYIMRAATRHSRLYHAGRYAAFASIS